jgi:N-carbamoylputrescine amidase
LANDGAIMKLHVAAIQLPAAVESIDDRFREAEGRMRLASAQGARLLVFPELSLTGYEFGARGVTRAERVPGPMVTALAGLARTYDVIAVAGVIERSGSDCFDTCVVVGPDGYLGKYRKIHMAFTENAYWHRGDRAGIVETDIGSIGLGICADMAYRTPWAWYRDRVDIVAVGSAWPDWRGAHFFPVSHGCRRTIAEAILSLPRKISRWLGVPVVHANCCGSFSTNLVPFHVSRFKHGGCSNIAQGETVAQAEAGEQAAVVMAEVEVGNRRGEESEWMGPWIPGATSCTQLQVYGGAAVLNSLFRGQYALARRARKKLLQCRGATPS